MSAELWTVNSTWVLALALHTANTCFMPHASPLGQKRSNTLAGRNGWEGIEATMQPLSPAAWCLLQTSRPVFLHSNCLEVSSESTS